MGKLPKQAQRYSDPPTTRRLHRKPGWRPALRAKQEAEGIPIDELPVAERYTVKVRGRNPVPRFRINGVPGYEMLLHIGPDNGPGRVPEGCVAAKWTTPKGRILHGLYRLAEPINSPPAAATPRRHPPARNR